jgi:hypothetical protein
MAERSPLIELTVSEDELPAHDPVHATPDPMLQRLLTIRTSRGSARFEQTDYGHPGRFNPWDPCGIDTGRQHRTPQLLALCKAIEPLLV